MSESSKNGARSTKTCDEQNWPTLSVVNDDTTSGAFGPPARRAWLILSSVIALTTSTWMLGYSASKSLTVASIAAISLGALQPCQNVIVVSAFGSSFAPPLVLPVHAVATNANTARAEVPTAFRWSRDMVLISCVASASGPADRLCGLNGVEDFVPGGRQRHAEATLQDWSVRYAGQLDRRPRHRQVGQLGAHEVEQPVTAGLEHTSAEHHELRIDHRHDRGQSERDAVSEGVEQLVPRAGSRERSGDGRLGRARAKAEPTGQLEHLGS